VQLNPAALPLQAVATRALQARRLRSHESLGDEQITGRVYDILPPVKHLLPQTRGEIPHQSAEPG
jgi:hypothetical protein